MAGGGNFARGFLSTYGPSYELAQKQKQDAFRTFYSDFLDRRKEKEKFDRDDAQKTKTAKALVGNFPEAKEGTWLWVREQLDAGVDQDLILEQLQSGQFKVTEMPAGQVGRVGEQGDPVDLTQQTQQGLGAPDQMNQEPEVMTLESLGVNDPVSNLSSKIRSLFDPKANKERQLNSIIEEAAKTSGMTVDQIKETMKGGWTSSDPSYKADSQKYQVTLDKSGLGLGKTKINSWDDAIGARRDAINKGNLQEAERIQEYINDFQKKSDYEHGLKNRDALGPELAKTVKEYSTSKEGVKTSLMIAKNMLQIVKDNPDVLDARIPGITSWAVSLATSFQNAASLFNGAAPEDVVKIAEKEIRGISKEIETLEKTPVGKNISRLDKANRLMTLQSTLMAYELAKSRGETGRSLTAVDFERYIGMVRNGVTPDTFKQSLALLLGGELERVRGEGETNIFQNPQVLNHKKNYPDVPFDVGVTSIDDDIASDDRLAEVEAELSKYSGLETSVPEDRPQPVAPKSKQEYDLIPPGTQYIAPDGSVRTKQ